MIYEFDVRVIPTFEYIACRHKGSYDTICEAFEELLTWAKPKGLAAKSEIRMIAVYHDDPRITDEADLRSDAGLIVTEKVKVSDGIKHHEILQGLYAIGRFEMNIEECQLAWDTMFRVIEEQGYEFIEGIPCFELYPMCSPHNEDMWKTDIYIPIKVK